jgi:transposase
MDRAALDSLDRETLIRLIVSQAEVIERLTQRVAELETKLNLPKKTPDNSSTPPSKGQKPSASAAGKDEGAGAKKRGKSHPGAHRPLHPNPTKNREIPTCACQHCGADVSQAPQFSCEAYDHIEIPPIKPEVTRVTLQGGTCPSCSKKFKAAPPPDMPKGSPFGENLRALVLYLRFTQNIALERLSTLLSTILGLEISEGAIVNILAAARVAFATQREAIHARLLSGTILQSDETGLRVGKDNWYLWVFHHEDSAVFVAKPTRAQTVIADFLGDFTPQYWVSDRYAGQLGWAEKENQVCLAHLIRDVQYAIECGDDVIGPDLRHLLGEACKIAARRDELSDATLKNYACRLETRLDKIMARTPTHPAGVKLKEMIRRTRRHLFVFMTVRELPATNNGSEQAIRPAVIFRKVTYCFRSVWGAELYADIRSVIETGRRRAIDGYEAIRLTLAGKQLPAQAPS